MTINKVKNEKFALKNKKLSFFLDSDNFYGDSYLGGNSKVSRREIIEHFGEFRRAIYEGPSSLVQHHYNTKFDEHFCQLKIDVVFFLVMKR